MVVVLTTVKFIELQIEKALLSLLSINTILVSAFIFGCKVLHTQVWGFLHEAHNTKSIIRDKPVFLIR